MTTDYTLVFDKLREVIETETAHVQLLVPNAAAEEVEEMKEIDEIRQVAEELAEPTIKYVTVPYLRIARFRLLEPPFPRHG